MYSLFLSFSKVPDYEKFVSNPMDLSKIRDKLEMLEYEDAFQFVDDVKLLFANSRKYNEVFSLPPVIMSKVV